MNPDDAVFVVVAFVPGAADGAGEIDFDDEAGTCGFAGEFGGFIGAIVTNSLVGEDAEAVIGGGTAGVVGDGVGVNHAVHDRSNQYQFDDRGCYCPQY